jgi:hypothetical protein
VTTLAYAGCFLALATLAGLAASSGGHWLLRLPVLAATPLLALGVWWQLSARDGWPAGARPAQGSEFVAGLVRSPSPGDAGAIFLWTQPPGTTTPRAYRLPYRPDLERQVARAAHDTKKGARVGVRFKKIEPRHGHGSNNGPGSELHFYRLPPPGVQVKGQRVASAG